MQVTQADQSRPGGFLRPFHAFFALESASGILLMLAAAVALVWANSPWSGSYFNLLGTHFGFTFGDATFQKTLLHWINDGLMAIFFFVVGLEIKREILAGELSSVKAAALPLTAAVGGMVVPAGVYVLWVMTHNGENLLDGWAVPMATDIAFALGVLA
ncbi:MAG TPA: Na+/H+ antiporter NhaA, partial [Tepidisphaeraceae bacterium]